MKLLKVLFILLLVLLLGFFLKDQILKTTVTIAAEKVMGTRVSLEQFSFRVLNETITLKNLKVYNPPGYPQDPFLDAPLIHVEYVLQDLLARNLHFRKIQISLKELVLVKDKTGKLNVDSLKVAEPKEKKADAAPAEEIPLKIDILELSMGKIILKDYTAGDPPKIQVHDLGYKKQVYKNITSAQQLAALIISEGLRKTALKGAGIYAAGSLLGVGFLPAGAAMFLIKSGTAEGNFDHPFEKVYDSALKTVSKIGVVSAQNPPQGLLQAVVDKHKIEIRISEITPQTTQVRVTARRFGLPRPQQAEIVLIHISDRLK
ncbi:MAG: hypothetical protein WC732_03920 [Candidatus Omnitrophota bacterium]